MGAISKSNKKSQYRVCNWSEYDKSLQERGSLTFWLSEDMIANWLNTEKSGKKGASNKYSNVAIELMATVQILFKLPGRQTEGFVRSPMVGT